jgi:hypothetical protein
MVIKQSPGKAEGFCFGKQMTQQLNKIFSILIVKKDVSSGDPPDNDMLQQPRDIDTSLAWHEESIATNVDSSTTSP